MTYSNKYHERVRALNLESMTDFEKTYRAAKLVIEKMTAWDDMERVKSLNEQLEKTRSMVQEKLNKKPCQK